MRVLVKSGGPKRGTEPLRWMQEELARTSPKGCIGGLYSLVCLQGANQMEAQILRQYSEEIDELLDSIEEF